MTWPTFFELLEHLTPTLVAGAAFVAALKGLNQAKETHKAVNSRMTELLALARKQAGDAATLAEKAAEHIRKGEAAQATVEATTVVTSPPLERK